MSSTVNRRQQVGRAQCVPGDPGERGRRGARHAVASPGAARAVPTSARLRRCSATGSQHRRRASPPDRRRGRRRQARRHDHHRPARRRDRPPRANALVLRDLVGDRLCDLHADADVRRLRRRGRRQADRRRRRASRRSPTAAASTPSRSSPDSSSPTAQPITGQAIKYTFNRMLSPKLASPGDSFFNVIAGAPAVIAGKAKTVSGIKATANTVTFTLTAPVASFLLPDDAAVRLPGADRHRGQGAGERHGAADRSVRRQVLHAAAVAGARPQPALERGGTRQPAGGRSDQHPARRRRQPGRAADPRRPAGHLRRADGADRRAAGDQRPDPQGPRVRRPAAGHDLPVAEQHGRRRSTTPRSARRSTTRSTAWRSSASGAARARQRPPTRSCRRRCPATCKANNYPVGRRRRQGQGADRRPRA